jgi:hypothetical protein
MAVRDEVREFVRMGPLPDSSSATAEHVDRVGAALDRISRPVTIEEARLLLTAFGPDECFGVAWNLVHLIETAGADVVTAEPPPEANEWVRFLWDRAERGKGRGWE